MASSSSHSAPGLSCTNIRASYECEIMVDPIFSWEKNNNNGSEAKLSDLLPQAEQQGSHGAKNLNPEKANSRTSDQNTALVLRIWELSPLTMAVTF